MLIFSAVVLAGCFAFASVLLVQRFLSNLELEKRIRARLERSSVFGERGIAGNIFFIAEKAGTIMNRTGWRGITMLSEKINIYTAILGAPYDKLNTRVYIGIHVFSFFGSIAVMILLLGIYNPLAIALAAAGAAALPYLYLKEKVKEKHKKISAELPDVIDLLLLMMEAGMEFNQSVERLFKISDAGTFVPELETAWRETELGKSKEAALADMAGRLGSQPLSAFCGTVNTAQRTGSGMTETLKSLSTQFRAEKLALAEKAANEAPLKMMLPMIIFIFPTVFIILFGPVLLSFINSGF